MPPVIAPHPPLDPDPPVRVVLVVDAPPPREFVRAVQLAVDQFSAFCELGGFPAVKPGTSGIVSSAGTLVYIDLDRLPPDKNALGVLGRMLLGLSSDWRSIEVQGAPARRPAGALASLASAIFVVPGLRDPLSTACDLDPGLKFYCVELTRRSDWTDPELSVLQNIVDNWMDVCRSAGLSTVTPGLEVVRGSVGMDPPQVGADFWAGQIGVADIDVRAVASLVNMFDHGSRTMLALDAITVR